MNPHRQPGQVDTRPEGVPMHRGPRRGCPSCGAALSLKCTYCGTPVNGGYDDIGKRCKCTSGQLRLVLAYVTTAIYCGHGARLRSGFLRLQRCKVPGEHTHQSCQLCGARWINATMEPVRDPVDPSGDPL